MLTLVKVGASLALAGAAIGAGLQGGQALDISGYRKWTKVNAEPIFMEPSVALLCSYKPWLSAPNPHVPKYFTVYVNDVGKKAMMAKGKTLFPVGSIIVKEKFAPVGANKSAPKDFKKPELLTIMRKREKGFNPKCGDWEFRTANGDRTLRELADVSHCISCHTAMPGYDYTYRTYVDGAAQEPWDKWKRSGR